MDFAGRLKRIREEMRKRNIGLMFLHPGATLWWAVGLMRGKPEYTDHNAYGDYAVGAYISVDDRLTLVLPPRPHGIALEKQVEGKPWIKEVRVINSNEKPRDVMTEVVKAMKIRGGVALDDRAWSSTAILLSKTALGSVISAAGEITASMRMIKDREEVEAMRRTAEITDQTYAEVVRFLRIGLTPFEVAGEINYQFAKRGIEYPSFETGVRFTRPGKPRSFTDNGGLGRPLELGDAVTFDFGACFKGYCSDFGRTCFVGEPPSEYKRVHETVNKAQSDAVKKMVDGSLNAMQLDRIARKVIEDSGHGDDFGHRLGHGIGVSVHEPPYLYQPDETILRSGMMFTIEPSILLKQSWSCRVEDVVMVTSLGGEYLTKYPRELTII
jgi:Xaa-Pro aminopeptidase